MNKRYKLLGLGLIALGLTACQSTPRQYNGSVGYQIESQSDDSATLIYTLSIRPNERVDEKKLQRACQKVLNSNRQYKLSILSISEIANPEIQTPQYGRQLGQSRTSLSLSNTPDLYNSENMATRQSLEARPTTLSVVRYTCS